MRPTNLFLRKLGVAFLVGFVPVLTQQLVSLVDGNVTTLHAIAAALISGAGAALVRAILAVTPGLTLVPSDAQPVLEKNAPPPS